MKQILIIFSLFFLISCGNDNYEILNENVNMNVSRIDVKLNSPVDKVELKRISTEIRADRKNYDKVWISFYLPDFLPESGINAWAIASFTPVLEVEILGEDKHTKTAQQIDFPKFRNVMEMLEESHDFKGHNLEKISDNPLHIRVSSDFIKGELEENAIEQTKRDIVYVVFQTFAETDIDKITVTSIPILRENFNPNLPYDGKLMNKLKQTKTVNRTQAIVILEKYIKTRSFKDLYQLNETMYLPNDKFDLLQFGQLENVYNDLK